MFLPVRDGISFHAVGADATFNEMLLFQMIKQYSDINKVCHKLQLKATNHRCYLGLVPLSLFSVKVSIEDKIINGSINDPEWK